MEIDGSVRVQNQPLLQCLGRPSPRNRTLPSQPSYWIWRNSLEVAVSPAWNLQLAITLLLSVSLRCPNLHGSIDCLIWSFLELFGLKLVTFWPKRWTAVRACGCPFFVGGPAVVQTKMWLTSNGRQWFRQKTEGSTGQMTFARFAMQWGNGMCSKIGLGAGLWWGEEAISDFLWESRQFSNRLARKQLEMTAPRSNSHGCSCSMQESAACKAEISFLTDLKVAEGFLEKSS